MRNIHPNTMPFLFRWNEVVEILAFLFKHGLVTHANMPPINAELEAAIMKRIQGFPARAMSMCTHNVRVSTRLHKKGTIIAEPFDNYSITRTIQIVPLVFHTAIGCNCAKEIPTISCQGNAPSPSKYSQTAKLHTKKP